MPLDSSLPPWLNIGPRDYLQAIQAGTQSGLEAARMRAAAQEAAARTQLAREEAARNAWQFGETMRQRAQAQAEEDALKREQLAQTGQYQAGMLDWRNEQMRLAAEKALAEQAHRADVLGLREQGIGLRERGLDETQRRFEQMQALRESVAANKLNPTDYTTETETIEATPATDAIPGQPYVKKSLFGIDALWKDQPEIKAEPAVPAQPERRITRRVPIGPASPAGGTLADIQADDALRAQFGKPTTRNEVIRLTKQGRKAVFDADTKEFIRYAD